MHRIWIGFYFFSIEKNKGKEERKNKSAYTHQKKEKDRELIFIDNAT